MLCMFHKYSNKNTYLNVIGYFLESSTVALKSETISLQAIFGLSQSGFPGHQILCLRDCKNPRGSRISKTIRTFRLQLN